jgi:hypothetical protein
VGEGSARDTTQGGRDVFIAPRRYHFVSAFIQRIAEANDFYENVLNGSGIMDWPLRERHF